jgi:hypothetical protein
VKAQQQRNYDQVWPRLMTERDLQALKNLIRVSRQTSSKTITRQFRSANNYPDSTKTVSRVKRMGFHGRASAHKQNTSAVNAKRRLQLCEERRHWTVDN